MELVLLLLLLLPHHVQVAVAPHCSNTGPHGPVSPWDADEATASDMSASMSRRRALESGAGTGSVVQLEPVPLGAVRLGAGSWEAAAQETNRRFLMRVQTDSLLFNTRLGAGMTPPGAPLHGWETPGASGRGSFEGHWLSAASRAAVAIPAPELGARVHAFVAEARRLQLLPGPRRGFVGGMDPAALDQLFAVSTGVPTMNASISGMPLYHIHKWLAGMLDAHKFLGDEVALQVATGLFEFLEPKMAGLIENHGRGWWDDILQWEFGGMNDVLYELFARTGNVTHLHYAQLFDKPCFLGPLALATPEPKRVPQAEVQDSPLYDMHGNAHLPIMVGAAK
eukprot:SAG22_NODE_3089_length_1950_cov_1.398703_3_plen_337_part_01